MNYEMLRGLIEYAFKSVRVNDFVGSWVSQVCVIISIMTLRVALQAISFFSLTCQPYWNPINLSNAFTMNLSVI